ncbi:MAG TPA: hypothetical protein VN541_15590 [Tepidisphaeraceae bacterium]|nr:hypothetical protein [Tepidisphaeraceae bacterium]
MSPRKRTPKQDSQPETATTTAELPETAVAEPPIAETKPEDKSFAERVGQRAVASAPDPFRIAADYIAGVRLFESKQDRQMALKFGQGGSEDKPSQAVIDKLKEAGYRWNPSDRIWAHPVRGESAMSTRIEAEKLYQEVRQMIRQDKGIGAGQDIPF